jgi:alkylation response protein AidB-like acyl-CoA dehydrogenase
MGANAMIWDEAAKGLAYSPGYTIMGGTSNVMRNILGEQVLGLPGEPRVDKDQPWIKVPRN